MKTMGETIAQKRKEKGMTQAQLAAVMNVTDKAVSKWERDIACPDIASLATLAAALDMPVDELLNARGSKAPKSETAEIISLILKAVPLAMGVATTVLAILGQLDLRSGFILLGLGMACLAVGALSDKK